MSKATLAILHHYKEQANHEYCPKGKNSWCSFNRDEATEENTHKPIKDLIPQADVEIIKPLIERLGSPRFCAAVENYQTQNVNESFHHFVWQLAPKDTFTSTIKTRCALHIAVILFNEGHASGLSKLFNEMGITVSKNMENQWKDFDGTRLYHKSIQQQEKTKIKRKKLKRKKWKSEQAFVRKEGTIYKSGEFHLCK